MELTVCICTHDRPGYVRDCLAGLGRQTTGPEAFAVLVVDSGSGPEAGAALRDLVAATPNASLVRLDCPGVSAARNAGARAARTPYVAYTDDDAVPAPDWVACILRALTETHPPPAVLGGRALPLWQAPLPRWWPRQLIGVLSIIDVDGRGAYGDPHLPADLAPWAVNMVVNIAAMRTVGGFGATAGRVGDKLLSDEDVLLAWQLRAAGWPVRYDSRIVVHHQIQAARLTPEWLLRRLYWQGISTVMTRRMLRQGPIWREMPRRLVVAAACAPVGLLPRRCSWLIGARWRLAYALGFIRAALGRRAAAADET